MLPAQVVSLIFPLCILKAFQLPQKNLAQPSLGALLFSTPPSAYTADVCILWMVHQPGHMNKTNVKRPTVRQIKQFEQRSLIKGTHMVQWRAAIPFLNRN